MKRLFAISLCLGRVLLLTAFGFSTDGSSISRSCDRNIALTNALFTMTVTFTNGGSNDLRGFVYSEEIPSGLTVMPLSVKLNGNALTSCLVEFGQDGDVYPLNTPCRWVLEQPAEFVESNIVPAGGTVQIAYALSSAVPGPYTLQQFSWAAFNQASTNAEFGYSEDAQQQTLTVVESIPPTLTEFQYTVDGFKLKVSGVDGLTYAIETSTDLSSWSALVTNTAPFAFTDTNASAFSHRFYRAVSLP